MRAGHRPSPEPDRRLSRLAAVVTETARQGTGMDVAYLARMVDDEQEVRAVSAAPGCEELPWITDLSCTTGLCRSTVRGGETLLIADATASGLHDADRAAVSGVGAWIGLPLLLADGSLYGALCVASACARPDLGEAHLSLLRLVAQSVTGTVWTFGQRESLERTRAGILAGAAHDLSTPLTAVETLIEDLADGSIDAADALPLMRRCAGEVRGLVAEALDAAAVRTPDVSFHPETCDLVELIKTVARTADAAGHVHRVHVEAPERLGAVVDVHHLRRAMQNLVENALKYSPLDAPVIVRLSQDGEQNRIEVSDRGDGVPATDIGRLTERFFRSGSAERSHTGGHGLGLAMVKLAADLHGGELEISSKAEQGSTFTLVLPRYGLTG